MAMNAWARKIPSFQMLTAAYKWHVMQDPRLWLQQRRQAVARGGCVPSRQAPVALAHQQLDRHIFRKAVVLQVRALPQGQRSQVSFLLRRGMQTVGASKRLGMKMGLLDCN